MVTGLGAPKLMSDAEYARLKDAVRRLIKVDLDYYKSNQMVRRLSGFIDRVRAASVEEFCARLEKDPELRTQLKDFLTINVTEFFRDTNQFEILEREVLPETLRQSASPRIWSAGCSRGAEAYSVAMILEDIKPGMKYRILGTDLDRQVVELAKAGGPYSDADLKGVSRLRLQRYFTQSPAGRFVKPELRVKVEFREGDLFKDRFETGFDLILCRNVVIYFSDVAKTTLNTRFSASLRDGGIFFIGGTETIFDPKAFGLERINTAFYRKVGRQALQAAA
jgi:chemotaxis protein methyltransferase CheR